MPRRPCRSRTGERRAESERPASAARPARRGCGPAGRSSSTSMSSRCGPDRRHRSTDVVGTAGRQRRRRARRGAMAGRSRGGPPPACRRDPRMPWPRAARGRPRLGLAAARAPRRPPTASRPRRRASARPRASSRPPACLSSVVRWRSTRSSSRRRPIVRGCSATITSSRKRRRSAGPPFSRTRSSGENTETRSAPSRSRLRARRWRFTSTRVRPPVAGTSASISTSRPSWCTTSARTTAASRPRRTSASVPTPRKLSSSARNAIGLDQVGLALAVVADDRGEAGPERQLDRVVVAEPAQPETPQQHRSTAAGPASAGRGSRPARKTATAPASWRPASRSRPRHPPRPPRRPPRTPD